MKRSGFQIMARLIGLVKPLTGYMILAITMGLIGHLCAAFIAVFGGYTILHVLHPEWSMSLGGLFGAVLICALARGFLRYAEQACNHFIAFKLLDEPTSNLDSLNEAVILKSLHQERNGKTVVLVSHRKSTMGIADTVYSVEHGRMS